MKILSLILIAAMILVAPSVVFAGGPVSLTVSATVESGTNLGQHAVLECTGYNYNDNGDPWTQCNKMGAAGTLDFGTLTTRLLDKTTGADAGGAGCFYGPKFFIVYLYPDAWGGKGYDLKQTSASFSSAIADSVVMKPVYSPDDKYLGQPAQGSLNDPTLGITGEVLGLPILAAYSNAGGSLILKAKRPRIVRAQYSIPPIPKTGDPLPAPNWKKVPLETTANGYSGTITISITPW